MKSMRERERERERERATSDCTKYMPMILGITVIN